MSFIYCNPNPSGKNVGDCVIRAISICMDKDWIDTYTDICLQGLLDHDMPSSNAVWSQNTNKVFNSCSDQYHKWCFQTFR